MAKANNVVCSRHMRMKHLQKKEAAVYLLDHPQHGHRSGSSSCLELSGTPPTVFIRTTKDMFGCLIRFVEFDATVLHTEILRTTPKEIPKVCISRIRFGYTDGHNGNTLVKEDANGIHRYNEECLGGYNLRKLWWSLSTTNKKYITNVPMYSIRVAARKRAGGVLKMINEEKVIMESLMCLHRAGANIILTYFALQAATCLCGKKR
ncbi:unnamed protein product [Arabis nemorensis]|uniref:porphobilinogen synthase n=1 Tax=Arabis nemorensis TaxID=586526 RepID=A0A565AZZ5_9BRAS|nr:unnamed protein product [Arabis nemorensis]